MTVKAIAWGDADTQAFIDLPWDIYPGEYNWIPPIKASLQLELSPLNLFFQHGEAQPFVYVRDGKVLGRLVASIDKLLTQSVNEIVGHFGYFECVNDESIAVELLAAAEKWLAERCVTHVHGPINLTIFNGYRLLTEGFETQPFTGEPRSPDYYIRLLEAAGYGAKENWYSWEFNAEDTGLMNEHSKKALLQKRSAGDEYRIEVITKSDFYEELPAIYRIGMEAFKENYGYSNIGYEEFKQIYTPLYELMVDGSFIKSVSPDGEVVGFVYGFPDVAPAFLEIDGDYERLSILNSFMPSALVYMNVGLLKEHRGCSSTYDFAVSLTSLAMKMGWSGYGALVKEGVAIYNSIGSYNRKYSVFSKSIA